MPRENSFSSKGVLLIFLLLFGTFWKPCDSQVNREEANKPEDGRRGDGGAFFAMRSCQQLLHADGGEFFSPDYLCSNPPLWCNWTIQVDPAKRIHLHLEDMTPDDDCLLKEDQLHVDEPAGGFRTHRVLQKCWREAKYTSSSNTLYVVLLIGGWPSPPYRGFYGRYQAFGPLVVYNPHEEFTETNEKSEPSAGLMDFNEIVMNEEQMDSDLVESASPANTDLVYDYYDQPSDTDPQRGENQLAESETNSPAYPSNTAASTVPTFVQGTTLSERGATPTPTSPQQQHGGQNQGPRPTTSSPTTTRINVEEASARPDEASARPDEASARPDEASARPDEASARPDAASARPDAASARPDAASARPDAASARPDEASARPDAASARPDAASARPDAASARPDAASARPDAASARPDAASARPDEASARPDEASARPEESPSEEVRTAEGENRTVVREASDQHPVSSAAPEPEKTKQTHPHPNIVELLSDHRGNLNFRNHSDVPHLPGDHLFEVALEVNFRPDSEETWDNLSRSLPVKALISEQLKALRTPLSMSSKRIKRLSTGVLYILWLQIGQEHGGPQVHQVLHSGLQGLITAGNDVSGNRRKAVLISVSIADVNECGTQLVLCDVNADCLNQFGSYSCRCKPGFQDKSRQGPGGTICLDLSAGCSSGLSAETKAVYVLFFLLSFLILMLLVAAGLLYHRHHRGEFLVRCDGSGSRPDPVDRHRHHDDCDLPPPPPPPARGFRESWPQAKERYPVADLPLLSFSPLLPPDYKERKLGKSDPKS